MRKTIYLKLRKLAIILVSFATLLVAISLFIDLDPFNWVFFFYGLLLSAGAGALVLTFIMDAK